MQSGYLQEKRQLPNREIVYNSQCPFCSVQCKMQLIKRKHGQETSYDVVGIENPTSKGRLCVKGLNAHQHAFHPDRLTQPLAKVNGKWLPISWDEALKQIAENVQAIQQEDGHDAMAVYGSASITNEEAYLLGKFARVALKTRHIDYNGRLCMSAAASAATTAFGIDRGLTNSLEDVLFAECLMLVGTNLAECQPTLMPYIEQAKKNGAFLIVIDPRETATAQLADLHIKLKPGTDAALANGLLKCILEGGYEDAAFIQKQVEGFAEVKAHIAKLKLENIAEQTGVSGDVITKAAETFAKARTGMIFTARGVEQQTNGSMAVRNFLNVLIATGKLGKHACGFAAVTGQSNGQGAREHGQKADQLPGYRSIENEEHRAHIAAIWGISPEQLPRKGVSAFEMMKKADKGEITGMFLMCSNPVVSHPQADFVKNALKKLKFLVAVDLFVSETAQLADLILPSTSYLEDEGTMTNVEGRVTLREASMPPYGEARHDWQIICNIAAVLGKGTDFSYSCSEDIFTELRMASKGGIADYYGITYERLRKEKGIFWPCPSLEHPGTPLLFTDCFYRPNKKALMTVVPNDAPVPKEKPSRDYPLYLTTGRVLAHYLTGVQTRNSASLMARNFESFVEMHPETAKKHGIADRTLIKLTTKQGSMIVRCHFTETIREDTVFVPFHWSGKQNVNRIITGNLDPDCRMPAFKVSAVRAEPLVVHEQMEGVLGT
ncbi:assimilatory nitrate reductase catalytic subunit [Shouchella clausii]|uniref:assimilatory nitrate reductase catalytic subunit NasC n=1 Tax=Shouchella clausii TaxID=79880 RepID=UPI001B2CDEC7|nr:molybdopterin oxidoreductase family protein [Shouchella clausii]GIN08106.1 assimilatory nitrate reductase catalytic subunit [Shouchella clausii]